MICQPAAAALFLIASAGLIVPAGAATIDVTIVKMAFTPAETIAHVGDTIQWVNKDFVAHTATARDKSFDVVIPAHGTGTLTVTAPKTLDYFCRFHPMMTGKLLVGGN
jgi:plastocyanin